MSGWAGFWIMLGLFVLASSLESVAEGWWYSRKTKEAPNERKSDAV